MAKRKLGFSVIVLMVAAITLISGTYAWFMVGGFASLFDIGFDVIEASGGILLQGDAGTASKGVDTWGTSLDREDFEINSFIVSGGSYRPVSSTGNGAFQAIAVDAGLFNSAGVVATKQTATTPSDMVYNDFTFRMKSSNEEEVPGGDGFGAYITVDLSGAEDEAENQGPKTAARVAVTIDGGTPVVYSYDGEAYSAVTAAIPDNAVTDNDGNQIITSDDSGSAAAVLAPVSTTALKSGDGLTKIFVGKNLPSSTSTTGVTVRVQIWLEGNDKDCVDQAGKSIAGKDLIAKVAMGVI